MYILTPKTADWQDRNVPRACFEMGQSMQYNLQSKSLWKIKYLLYTESDKIQSDSHRLIAHYCGVEYVVMPQFFNLYVW